MIFRQAVKAIPGAVWLKRKLFGLGFSGTVHVPLRRASDRGAVPARKRIPRPPDFPAQPRFVLYRIIGNDLVPRHRKGQARANLPFILRHESNWPDCEKWFLVNRIVDKDEEAAIIRLLENAGCRYLHIPFEHQEYASFGWDLKGVPPSFLPTNGDFYRLKPEQKARVIARLNRLKINYFTHNNGARNIALEHGRSRADWILPWDGNCFLSDEAWHEIRSALLEKPDTPYWLVPMARCTDNNLLLQSDFRPLATDEPQIIFRRDAEECFDEEFIYGRRPKVELFWRLGVPGPWDDWGIEPWDHPCPPFSPDAGAWSQTGWVARLSSGRRDLEASKSSDSITPDSNRALIRAQACMGLVDRLDQELISRKLNNAQPLLGTNNTPPHAPEVVNQALRYAESAFALWYGSRQNIAMRSAMQACFTLTLACTYDREKADKEATNANGREQKVRRTLAELVSRLTEISNCDKRRFRVPRSRRSRDKFFPELVFMLDCLRLMKASDPAFHEIDQGLAEWLPARATALQAAYPLEGDDLAGSLMEKIAIHYYLGDLIGLRDTLRDAQAWRQTGGSQIGGNARQRSAALLLDLVGRRTYGLSSWPSIEQTRDNQTAEAGGAMACTPVTLQTLRILQDSRLRLRADSGTATSSPADPARDQ